jgi:hypothetical protein
MISPQPYGKTAGAERAARVRLWLQPRDAIGQLTDLIVRRLRHERDILHRAGLERGFLATEKGRTYRAHPRYETFYPGEFSIGDQSVDCVVLNISVGGAKLRVSEPIGDASQVRLRIDRVGDIAGRLVWRDGTTMGIAFHDQLRDIDHVVEDMLSSTTPKDPE